MHCCYWHLRVAPFQSPVAICSFPSGFCLSMTNMAPPCLHPEWRIRSPAVLIGSTKGCCWTVLLWFLSSSCFCTPSLNSDAGGSEQLERTLEYGTIHQQPLEGRTSRSWKPPKPGSPCTGSESRVGLGVVPCAREEGKGLPRSIHSVAVTSLSPSQDTQE